MKNYKKIGQGIFATFFIFILAFTLMPTPRALAVAQQFFNNKIFSGAKYTLNQNGTITTTLVDNSPTGSTNYPLVFTDSTPNNSTHVYVSDKTYFCKSQTDFRDNVAATITLSAAPSGKTINGQLSAWVLPSGGSACTNNSGSITITNLNPGTGGGGGLPKTLSYNGSSYTLVDSAYPVYGLNGGVKGGDCYGGSVIVANSTATNGTAYVGLVGTSGVTALSTSIIKSGVTDSHILSLVQGCFFNSTAKIDGYSGSITNGNLNAPTPAGSTTDTNAPTQTTCEKNSGGWDFSWAVCPILDAASGLSNALINLFEDQLSFSVNQLGTSADQVHQSWALIRDIATALVVVVMLIMVFSQAASFGPFDAYTIRKLLPRMVAVVILIQISWIAGAYVIDLVNAIANGIADLMYYPFGGSGNMDLFSLLGHAKLGGTELGVLNWAAVGVAIALGVAFLFSMLGVAFVAIVALFFAVLTLIFRKVLIILLLVFAPLALLAWVLPGTERYWKLWRENFIKVLFMFPIIVAIIAAGRIFAYVVGGQNNSEFLNLLFILVGFFGPLFLLPRTFKWGGQAMQAAGNGIMRASSKVSERPKKFLDSRQEGWSAERRRQSEERVAGGVGFNKKAPWRYPLDKFRSGAWDPTLGAIPKGALGGRLNKEGSRRREASIAAFKKAGRDTYNEDLGAARIGEQIDWEALNEGGDIKDEKGRKIGERGIKDDYLQAIFEGKPVYWYDENGNAHEKVFETYDGRRLNPLGKSRMQKLAALYEMEKLGGATNNRHILKAWENVQEAGPQSQAYSDFRRFMSDSVGSLMPSLTDIYKGTASTADSGPAGVARQHGSEVENMLASLTNRIKVESDPGKRAEAVKSLNTYLSSFVAAAESDSLRGNVELGATRVIKALATDPNEILTDSRGNQVSYTRDVYADRKDSEGKPTRVLLHKAGEAVKVRDSILDPIYNDPEDGRVTLGFKNAELALDDEVISTINPELRKRLDTIIRPEGGFVDSASIRASANPTAQGEVIQPTNLEGEVRVDHGPPPATTGTSGWSTPSELPPEPNDQGPLRPPQE